MSDDASAGTAAMPLEDRKVLLEAAFQHGETLQRLAVFGESYAKLSDYVAAHNDITETLTPHGCRLTFAKVVYWEVTVDEQGIVQGIFQSGYGPLMALLGIDFSGAPFGEDCG